MKCALIEMEHTCRFMSMSLSRVRTCRTRRPKDWSNISGRFSRTTAAKSSRAKSDAPAAAVQEMERLMRLHDDVMRVLTIKVDEHAEGPSVQMQKRDERGERRERRA